jgi:hypothetical protein
MTEEECLNRKPQCFLPLQKHPFDITQYNFVRNTEIILDSCTTGDYESSHSHSPWDSFTRAPPRQSAQLGGNSQRLDSPQEREAYLDLISNI